MFVNGNNSWKFHDDAMTETLWKERDGQTYVRMYKRTYGPMDRRTEVFLELLGRS